MSESLERQIKEVGDQINRLQERLDYLRKLAEVGAQCLPQGFIVAEITSWDTTSSKYDNSTPDEYDTTYMAVPEEMGSIVYCMISSSGVEARGNGLSWYGVYGDTEEEAIEAFFCFRLPKI